MTESSTRRATKKQETDRLIGALLGRCIAVAKASPSRAAAAYAGSPPSVWGGFVAQCRSELGAYVHLFDQEMKQIIAWESASALNDRGRALIWARLGKAKAQAQSIEGDERLALMAEYLLTRILKPLVALGDETALPGDPDRLLVPGIKKESAAGEDLGEKVQATPAAGKVLEVKEDEIYTKCCALWDDAHRDLKGGTSALPELFLEAFARATDNKDCRKILDQVKKLVQTSQSGVRGLSKLPALGVILQQCDPGLLFEFARPAVFPADLDVQAFFRQVTLRLKDLCPNRDAQIEELVLAVARRTLGDKDTLYPLLYGPAGTAKTYVVELLAEVFSDAGLRTRAIMQPMTQLGGDSRNNEVAMALQGTSPHWGDGRQGMLFSQAMQPETALCLAILDEVDKCRMHDYLVTLLDPRQPLQDSFVREFLPRIDMRHKCLFFLTANRIDELSSGTNAALWSRLRPIEMPAYSRADARDLVARLVLRRVDPEQVTERMVWDLTDETLRDYPDQLPSVRTLIDGVKKRLFQKRFSFLRGVPVRTKDCAGQTIGFKVEVPAGANPTRH